jgi:hypothetical protein
MISSNVQILHPASPPLAGFLRVGHTGYHKLEAVHATGRLGFSRLVFDAAHALGQADFLRTQRAAGREIVLDLNVAETAMRGRFGSAVGKLQRLGMSLILDMAGGFAGLSALAFGAFGGISHGAGQRERFDLAEWRKPPNGKGGGAPKRAYVAELDRDLTSEQLQAFFSAKGVRTRFACADSSCCTRGYEDMLDNCHGHFITQRSRQLGTLSTIPPVRRADYVLSHQLEPAVRSTRQASRFKFRDQGVQKLVVDANSRLTRLCDALGALHEADGSAAPLSASPLFRGSRLEPGGMSVIQRGLP